MERALDKGLNEAHNDNSETENGSNNGEYIN